MKILLILLLIPYILANQHDPEVTIKQGVLRGKAKETKSGRTFSAFTAVPYAKPPVGELRFKPPVAAEPWEGILDATKPHPVCPQPSFFLRGKNIIGDEDCLYLNVYTPQLPRPEGELLPVMFYIHGGGWFAGSGSYYGPDLLMDKDVVLVTINYRLGALGFFTTGDLHAIGNDGLKDQVMALKWVKNNIDKFGGDPNSITVLGQSAGGASAHYLMLSPLSRDLIKGVIAQSGTALTNWAIIPHFRSTRRSKTVAVNLGCPGYPTDELMECLRKVDAHDIIKATEKFLEWDTEPLMPFKPVIEPKIPGAFMPEDSIDIIKSGKAGNVPFMFGLTTDEGGIRAPDLFNKPELVKDLNENFDKIAPIMLIYDESAARKHLEGAAPAIRKFYFQDKPIDESTKDKFVEMYGDALFLSGIDVAVDLHVKFSKQPVYYYLFGYEGTVSYCQLLGGTSDKYGSCHGDDTVYLFNQDLFFPNYEPTESDQKMNEFMTTLWANFAKYGNPTPETDSNISVNWEPVQQGKQNYYHIKSHDDVELAQGLYKERATFWRDLPLNIRKTWIRDEL